MFRSSLCNVQSWPISIDAATVCRTTKNGTFPAVDPSMRSDVRVALSIASHSVHTVSIAATRPSWWSAKTNNQRRCSTFETVQALDEVRQHARSSDDGRDVTHCIFRILCVAAFISIGRPVGKLPLGRRSRLLRSSDLETKFCVIINT